MIISAPAAFHHKPDGDRHSKEGPSTRVASRGIVKVGTRRSNRTHLRSAPRVVVVARLAAAAHDDDVPPHDSLVSLKLVARAPKAHQGAILALAAVDGDRVADSPPLLLQTIIATSMDKTVSQWRISSSSAETAAAVVAAAVAGSATASAAVPREAAGGSDDAEENARGGVIQEGDEGATVLHLERAWEPGDGPWWALMVDRPTDPDRALHRYTTGIQSYKEEEEEQSESTKGLPNQAWPTSRRLYAG